MENEVVSVPAYYIVPKLNGVFSPEKGSLVQGYKPRALLINIIKRIAQQLPRASRRAT
jgi:hypothetical protein